MEIAVLSGKGGTGKTTVAANLAYGMSFNFVDLDVEEPNGHIFLKPVIDYVHDVSIPTPTINQEKCTLCGKCAKSCQFNALINTGSKLMVFEDLCHGCGTCSLVCPEDAISEYDRKIGIVSAGKYLSGEYIGGLLNIKEPMSGPIITDIKKSLESEKNYMLDCSPGTSCNVVKAIVDVDYALLVTEPSKFGLHDLTLAIELVRSMNIPFGIIINRSNEYDALIEDYAEINDYPVLGKIPFSREAAKNYSEGKLLMDNDFVKLKFEQIIEKIQMDVLGVKACN